MKSPADEVDIQRRYYAETAGQYNNAHMATAGEHEFALSVMVGLLDFLGIGSVLDIGSGTGRVLLEIKRLRPKLRICGVEPVAELRNVAYASGLSERELVAGDAYRLASAAGDFDLVCEFGMLHHVRRPEIVVGEMLRVAKKAIFISDSNNFGQGSRKARALKQAINTIGMWPVFTWVRTRGRGYSISQGDGLFYSYSVFNNYEQITAACASVHTMNVTGAGLDVYRSAGHVALLGVK